MAFFEKFLSYSGYLKGFLFECVCKCRVSVEFLEKFLLYTLYWCVVGAYGCRGVELLGFWVVWTRLWYRSSVLLRNVRGYCV